MRDITSHLDALRAILDAQASTFIRRIRDEFLAPLQSGVEKLRTALPVATSVPSPEVIRTLREQLEQGLIPTYRAMLDECQGPAVLASSFRSWMTDLGRTIETLPAGVEDLEPEFLFAPSEADTLVTGLRKGAVRLGRRVRKVESKPFREIPMQALGRALQREWLPVQFGKVIDDDRKQLTRQLARLERAFSGLVQATLEQEACLAMVEARFDAQEADDESDPGAVSTALTALHASLDECADVFRSLAADSADRRVEQAWVLLQTEVERAGSFMADVPEISDEVFERRLSKMDGKREAWAAWQDRLRERAAFFRSLMLLRGAFDTVVQENEARIAEHLIVPIRRQTEDVAQRLSGIERRVADEFSRADGELFTGGTRDSTSLLSLGEQAAEQVQSGLVDPIQELSLLTRVSDENGTFIEGLRALQQELPEPYRMHPLCQDPDDFPDPSDDECIAALREFVLNGLTDITDDRLSERTAPARDTFKEALEKLGDLTSIVRFSFQSVADSAESSTEHDPAQQQEMVQESLRRTRDAIGAIRARIEEGTDHLARLYRLESLRAWLRIQDRVRVEHQVGAYVMDVRSRLDAEAREAGQRLSRVARQLKILSERILRRGHREARALIEKGKEAVGTPTQSPAAFHETALGLAELESVLEGVPPVYRKLFSFQPLSDPDLLIGRSDARTFIERHLEQFELGTPQAAVLVGGPSTGRTSLLNVIAGTMLREHDVRWMRINERPTSARQLLQLMRSSLRLDIPEADSIPEAARKMLARDPGGKAPVCLVEHMETLMMRGIGGYDLFADMLQFMSLTDSRIIWIGTVSSFAWQIMESANQSAAVLVNRHTLANLSRADLERLVMERHRKSGVPLTFGEPEDMSPLLRRRLLRVRSKDARQAVLREAYFDRLYTQFGQNIQMALLQWIRSITMESEGGRMQVMPVPPLNLSFFSGFHLDQAFALKALLEHGVLSPDEYAAVDRVSRDKALTLFESLGNALIIEAAGESTGALYRHTAIRSDQIYRIRPLFSHAVVRLLRERNIVH